MIETALAESNGKVAGPTGAAAKLGIPRSTLDSKIKQLKIKKHQFISELIVSPSSLIPEYSALAEVSSSGYCQ